MKNVQKFETEIKGEEWSKILDNTFKKRNKDLKVDGFRKGKCPKDIYLQRFGIESLFMDASDAALQSGFKKVLEENDLTPVVEPAVDIKSISKDGIKMEFTVITRPEVKLGKYKDLGVKKEKVSVSKEELEKEEARIASRYAEMVVKENGEVLEGNTAVIDFKGFVDGKELDGGTGEDIFRQMLDSEYAKVIASQNLTGISTSIENQLLDSLSKTSSINKNTALKMYKTTP